MRCVQAGDTSPLAHSRTAVAARHVFSDPEMHDSVRARCMDYMEANADHYAEFVAENFAA